MDTWKLSVSAVFVIVVVISSRCLQFKLVFYNLQSGSALQCCGDQNGPSTLPTHPLLWLLCKLESFCVYFSCLFWGHVPPIHYKTTPHGCLLFPLTSALPAPSLLSFSPHFLICSDVHLVPLGSNLPRPGGWEWRGQVKIN